MVVFKPFFKVIRDVADAAIITIELQDTAGGLINCTYAEIALSSTLTNTGYLVVTPSSSSGAGRTLYADYDAPGVGTVAAMQAASGGAGVVVKGPNGKAVIETWGSLVFDSLRIENQTGQFQAILITYGTRKQASQVQDTKRPSGD